MMTEELSLSENKKILVFEKNRVAKIANDVHWALDNVLISSWTDDELDDLSPLINALLDSGCRSFVCVGSSSEALHDFIDDVILEKSLENELEEERNVVTTWHDKESFEDTLSYFFNALPGEDCNFGVILDSYTAEDQRILTKVKDFNE